MTPIDYFYIGSISWFLAIFLACFLPLTLIFLFSLAIDFWKWHEKKLVQALYMGSWVLAVAYGWLCMEGWAQHETWLSACLTFIIIEIPSWLQIVLVVVLALVDLVEFRLALDVSDRFPPTQKSGGGGPVEEE